jgi:hypothetical protein
VSAAGRSEGTISVNKGTFQVIEIGSLEYFKANQVFWAAQNASTAYAQLLAGKWVYGPITSAPFSNLVNFLSPRKVINQLFPTITGPFAQAGTSSIGGQPVVAIVGTATGAGNGHLYVATTGKPYVVRLTGSGGSSSTGTVTFSRYNLPVRPVKPKGAVDLQQLSSAGS